MPQSRRPPGVELAVRIGIATGPVIVGDQIGEGTASETAVVGETPNLAARLQALAQPNQIVVSAATRAMLGDHFDLEDLGAYELKGFAEPVPAWRVLSARDVESRFAATRTGSSAPLVGRQEEMGLLLRAWDGSCHGRGQVVLIQGEAGVGKSRLVEGLREAAGKDHIWVAIRCSPFHTASAFHPIIEHLKRVFGWQPEDTAPQHLAKLEAGLAGFKTLPLSESVRLFADLMSVPVPEDRYPRLSMTAQQQRDATLDAIVAWLIEMAERTPVLMAWEDLHWADPTTLETLGMLIEQAPTAAMLVVATYRPELTPPWPQRSHMTPITLNRLERPEVETMVGHLAGGRPLPGEVVDHIVAKADGVPLYVEELTKAILGSGVLEARGDAYVLTGALAQLHIPETLQDLLMARLDRAPRLREVAQLGAVLGREFAYDMISALAGIEEEMLQSGLGPAGGRRTALPARPPAAVALPLQACADPGCGLPIAAEAHPPAVSRAGGKAAGGSLSRGGEHTTGAGGASLHRSELSGAGDRVLAQSRRGRGEQVGEPRSDRPISPRPRAGRRATGYARAGRAGAGPANGARRRPVRDQKLEPLRHRPNLCARIGALSATRGSLPGVHGAPRPVSPPFEPTRDGEGAAFCRGGVAGGRTARRCGPSRLGALGARQPAVLPGEARAGACALSAGLRDVRSEHAVPGLAGHPPRRGLPDIPDAHFLDARLPGSVPRGAEGRGTKRRDARAPVDPRPNTVLRRASFTSFATSHRRLPTMPDGL